MLNGLDLFSGIGGLAVALEPWVRPVAYCDNDRYAQAVLMSRQRSGHLHPAPIWDDVRTLRAQVLPSVDIIYGGFPCQDISCAGLGKGLAGERSGLVFEVFRLLDELRPAFVFLENVPAIRTRGGERVGKELALRGYDSRWTIVSAAEVGAPHLRKRWFCLAFNSSRVTLTDTDSAAVRDFEQRRPGRRARGIPPEGEALASLNGEDWQLAHADGARHEHGGEMHAREERGPRWDASPGRSWWDAEPNVGRVANGVPAQVDRLRSLGNSVVPLQARTAFARLCGIETPEGF